MAGDDLGRGAPMLAVERLHKRFGDDVALDGVDLTIQPGEVCALLGPNGAGKTTLVSIVAGLRSADAGSVHVDGVDVAAEPQRARSMIGLAPQDLGVYPGLDARANLALFGELVGLRGTALQRRTAEVAESLELTELLDRKVGVLSGGERRRVHTAMALMHRPPLLLLDEVTTGVDIRTRSRLLQTVTMLAEEGAAVCYSTHYLPEVEELDATVAIIDDGRLLARGGHQELVARHAAAALEVTFDGAAPDLDAALVAPGAVSRPRDEVVRIATAEPGATAAQVLAGLGAEAERVRNVEIITGDLDSVFLAITGRRYVSDDAGDGDGDGPDADGPVRTAEELA